MSAIDPSVRVTLTVRELLTIPKSPERDAIIRRTVKRARDADSREISTAAWVAAQHAEAEQHRRRAELNRAAAKLQGRPMPTAAELAWQEQRERRSA